MKALGIRFLALLFLAGCSATIEGVSPEAPPPPVKFTDKVTGTPVLDGHWLSDCVPDKWARSNNGYVKFDVTIKDRDVQRFSTKYSDSNCKTELSSDKKSKGKFRFIEKYPQEVYAIEYRYENGALPQENIRRDSQGLWISDRYTGEMVVPEILLREDSPSAPDVPAKKPEPVPPAQPSPPIPRPIKEHSPKYGQWLKYEGKSSGQNQKETYTNQGTTDDITFTIYRDVQGARQDMGYSSVGVGRMWSTAKHREKMRNCVADGGKIEIIEVRAGVFETCVITDSKRKTWMGNVPIWGSVKVEALDGSYAIELVDFGLE